jgi:ceramide glucosyltransferase
VSVTNGVLLTLVVLSGLYWLAANGATVAFRRQRRAAGHPAFTPSVSVLKPLCGADDHLSENLRAICEQDYPSTRSSAASLRPTTPPWPSSSA